MSDTKFYVWVARKKADHTLAGENRWWYISRPKWNKDGAFSSKSKASKLATLLKARRYVVKVMPRKPEGAAGTPAGLTIHTRDSWDAINYGRLETAGWKRTTPTRVHHTAAASDANAKTPDDERKVMRNIQRFHVGTRGYRDIAYNYVIFPSGRVYEGRGYNKVGAHTLNHNHDVGICFAGNFTSAAPTDAAVASFKALRTRLEVSAGKAYPHSSTFATTCPGRPTIKKLGL